MKMLNYLIAVGLIAGSSASAATVGFYEDETAFRADVSGALEVEDFTSFVYNTNFGYSPLDVGDFTLSATYSGAGYNTINAQADLAHVHIDDGETASLTFDRQIYALGLKVGYVGQGEPGHSHFSATTFTVPGKSYTSEYGTYIPEQFFGFISDSPFDSLNISAIFWDGLYIYEVLYGFWEDDGGGVINPDPLPPTAAVPLPAALPLYLAALGLGGAVHLRRRRRT